jgi:hypothetical protein
MVSVKPISELRIAEDGCFAFVGLCSSLSITYEHPGGIGEREDFEAFGHENGTIIRFDKMATTAGTSWSLTAVLDSGEEYLLHLPAYEENYNFWENTPTRAHEFLGFLDSVEITTNTDSNRALSIDGRCDVGMYGPRLHYVTDGIKPTQVDFSLIDNAFISSPMISINGISHINSQYVNKIDMSWRNWPCVTLTAKTLSGMLRQLCEWRDLYLAEISTEYYAEDAAIFIDRLGITEEMIKELKESEVSMPTERFMKGYGDPRHGFSETGNLPISIKNHLKKQLFYRTLSSLEAQHPEHPSIDKALKDEEKAMHQIDILRFAHIRMPNVKIEDITTQKIYDCAYQKGEFKYVSPAPLDIDIPLVLKAVRAARFFDATS